MSALVKRRLVTLSLLTVSSLSLFAQSFKPVSANPVLLPAVQACISNPQCTALVVTIGGVAYYQLTQFGKTVHIPLAPMLRDPESQSYPWYDYIWADSEAEAIRKCREYAKNHKVDYVKVIKVGNKRYECHVEG